MLVIICLWWVGIQLSAPTWFYPILGRIPPLLSEVKVGDECRFSDVF